MPFCFVLRWMEGFSDVNYVISMGTVNLAIIYVRHKIFLQLLPFNLNGNLYNTQKEKQRKQNSLCVLFFFGLFIYKWK